MPSDDFSTGPKLDALIDTAIHEGRIPGAVLLIGHEGQVVYRKAYGKRSLEPTVEDMTLDTIFDCASLTKVVSTTSCMMRLYEQGRFTFEDPITKFIPEFRATKDVLTIRDLMTHFSGLQPDVPLKPVWQGYDTGIELACTFAPEGKPGEKHVYSDINFLLIGEMIHRLSGKTLAQFAHDEVFVPVGMTETAYQPSPDLIPRIAPTEREADGKPPLRGVVHDPTARYMGGIAGHAGMFSTADDLAKFGQMMLDGGKVGAAQVFKPETIALFTSSHTPEGQPVRRGYGWDIDSPYSSPRGTIFPIGSFGHTGFTGTSLWIDPRSKTYVILLTNSIHPVTHGGVVQLRREVSTLAAEGVGLTGH